MAKMEFCFKMLSLVNLYAVRQELACKQADMQPRLGVIRTIMDVSGVPMEEYDYMRGRSLTDALTDCDDWEQESFMQISEAKCARAIRTKRWTYCVRADLPKEWTNVADADVYYEEFLYDNHADPNQLENLVKSPKYEDIRAELTVALKRRILDAEYAIHEVLPAK